MWVSVEKWSHRSWASLFLCACDPGELVEESVPFVRHRGGWRGWPWHHPQVCGGKECKSHTDRKSTYNPNRLHHWVPPSVCVLQAGANMIVSGSAVIGSDDPRSVITLLRTVVAEAIQKRSLDRWDVRFAGAPSSPPSITTQQPLGTDFSGVEDRGCSQGKGWAGGLAGVELTTKFSMWVKVHGASIKPFYSFILSCQDLLSEQITRSESHHDTGTAVSRQDSRWPWLHTWKHSWILNCVTVN